MRVIIFLAVLIGFFLLIFTTNPVSAQTCPSDLGSCDSSTAVCSDICGGTEYFCFAANGDWAWRTAAESDLLCNSGSETCSSTYQYSSACGFGSGHCTKDESVVWETSPPYGWTDVSIANDPICSAPSVNCPFSLGTCGPLSGICSAFCESTEYFCWAHNGDNWAWRTQAESDALCNSEAETCSSTYQYSAACGSGSGHCTKDESVVWETSPPYGWTEGSVSLDTACGGVTPVNIPIGSHAVVPPLASPFGSTCGIQWGWTCDADDYSQALRVDFYADGPAGTGDFIGNAIANRRRWESAIADQCGGNLNHGFWFNTPDSIKDGTNHSIYAYAINYPIDSGTNPLLSGSPGIMNCPLTDTTTTQDGPQIKITFKPDVIAPTSIPGLPSYYMSPKGYHGDGLKVKFIDTGTGLPIPDGTWRITIQRLVPGQISQNTFDFSVNTRNGVAAGILIFGFHQGLFGTWQAIEVKPSSTAEIPGYSGEMPATSNTLTFVEGFDPVLSAVISPDTFNASESIPGNEVTATITDLRTGKRVPNGVYSFHIIEKEKGITTSRTFVVREDDEIEGDGVGVAGTNDTSFRFGNPGIYEVDFITPVSGIGPRGTLIGPGFELGKSLPAIANPITVVESETPITPSMEVPDIVMPEPSVNETQDISNLTPESPTVVEDFDPETGIDQIQVEVKEEVQDASITILKYDGVPEGVKAKSGKIYKYLKIDAENLEGNLEKEIVTIQVEKSWVSSNGLNKEGIALFWFDEFSERWNELETIYSGEDTDYYYYDAELISFGYFVIGEKVIATAFGKVRDIKEERSTLWWWVLFILLVAMILVVIGVIYWLKIKSRRGPRPRQKRHLPYHRPLQRKYIPERRILFPSSPQPRRKARRPVKSRAQKELDDVLKKMKIKGK
jgi:PGF-pre-PGF domain-containing protein